MLADVETGTSTDRFLNQFVDTHSSMGHKGEFLDAQTTDDITSSGFDIVSDRLIDFAWSFDSHEAMGVYCKLLFGIDLAAPEAVIQGIEDTVGLISGPARVNMPWSLRFIVATCR